MDGRTPQSIGGVLDEGFKLYSASLSKVIVLTFIGMLLGQIPNLMMATPAPGAPPTIDSGVGVALLVTSVISMWLYAGVIGRMDAVANRRDLSMGEALSQGGRRLPALLGFGILYTLVVAVGMLLLLVPGIIFSLSLMFGFFGVLLDGQGPIEGLKASHRLVWGHWWRTLVIVSVATVIMLAAYMLVGFVAGFAVAMGSSEPEAALQVIQLVLVPVLGSVIAPLFYALVLACYYDLKVRRSGADLEQRLEASARA